MVSQGPAVARNAQELLSEFVTTGRQEPFEEIVRRYAGMVFNVCLQILKDTHDAEDATQAVFLTLAVQAKTANGVKYIGPWLQRVAQRLSLDVKRSKTRRKAREERHSALTVARNGANVPDHGRQLDMDELKTMLRDELDRLPAKYRLPLILHYFGGLKPEEMAKELGCKPSTLGVRLHRGRKMLADSMSSRGMMVSGSLLGVALAACVQSTVSDALIQSTGHAATQLAFGYPMHATGLSAQVMTFNRIATTGLTFSRLKAAISTGILIAGAVAGAAQVAVNHADFLKTPFGISNELKSWLAPLFRSLVRPLHASAPIEPTQKVEVTLANDLNSIPDKLLLSDPFVRPQVQTPLDGSFVIAPGTILASGANLYSSAVDQPKSQVSAPVLAYTPPAPQSDSGTRLQTLSTALPSHSTGGASQAASAVSSVPLSSDTLSFGARAGESVSFDFNRAITHRARQMTVGDHGSASINQTAGKVDVGEQLEIGKSSDGSGTYKLSGKSELTAKSIDVGQSGAGKVVHSSPAVASAETVAIGKNAGGSGVYDLKGGSLKTEELNVGVRGTGAFNQSGGEATSHGVKVAVESGSKGTVSLTGGTFSAQDQVVGNTGDGSFHQQGGINRTSNLKIGSADSAVGDYKLTGGQIEVRRVDTQSAPSAQIVVGSTADGVFQLGDQNSTGAITESGDGAPTSLVIRQKRSARGTLRGWGDVRLTGQVDDNGKIIADGFGTNRTLDLSAAAAITNTIENPPEGSNGWFARAGGKLVLPPLRVERGTSSHTWGESPDDGVVDLINSLRITLHDVDAPGQASIALASPDRSDIPHPPEGYRALSVWQTNLAELDASCMDLMLRYDQTTIDDASLDAMGVQLWTFDDTWRQVDSESTWVDSEAHLLYALGMTPSPLLAILTPGDFGMVGVPTPEPSVMLGLISAAGAMLARRRRI